MTKILLPLFYCAIVLPSCRNTPEPTSSLPMSPKLETFRLGGIKQLTTLGGYFFAGQPSPKDLELARDRGIKTVINLRHSEEIPWDEEQLIEKLGMKYVHIPFRGGKELSDAVFDRGREAIRKAALPAMIHCGSSNRVAALWFAARVLDQGASVDEALIEAKQAGLRSPVYVEKARDYVARQRKRRGF